MQMSVKDIAKMIDHSLLHPTMTDQVMKEGCEIAKECDVASVCIKPYAVATAAELLAGSDVLTGTVIGFPHGNSRTDVKVHETQVACKDGAVEIDMVINIGKALGGDWNYVETEIAAIHAEARSAGAIVKVIFENDYLSDEHKIRLCSICGKIGVAFVKTSSGYGFTKRDNGMYQYDGAVDKDLKLMREHSPEHVQVKAAGGVRSLDDVLRVAGLGVTRIGATATESIIAEARERGFPES